MRSFPVTVFAACHRDNSQNWYIPCEPGTNFHWILGKAWYLFLPKKISISLVFGGVFFHFWAVYILRFSLRISIWGFLIIFCVKKRFTYCGCHSCCYLWHFFAATVESLHGLRSNHFAVADRLIIIPVAKPWIHTIYCVCYMAS